MEKARLTVVLGALLLLVPLWAQAQGILRGRVTDAETGEPLPGANIVLVELQRGAASDIDGNYEIGDIPPGRYTLRASFVGYRTLEQAVEIRAGVQELNLTLQPDYTGLEEVVVTGIASRTSKARAEVAVSRVNTDELLQQNAYQDVSQLLNGKIAGVAVQPASGNVGGGLRFVVRADAALNGDGQPVIYVDGVRIDNDVIEGFGAGGQEYSMLANLNPEDIESIEVLKGPAGAALYGTSGANGVVLIRTKRGRAGDFRVQYKGVVGANQQATKYTLDTSPTPDVANSFFRDGAIRQHTLSVMGGTGNVRYYTSYDRRKEEGHILNNALDRQTFQANFEAVPNQKVTVRANASYTYNEIDRPQNDNNILGFLGNTLLFTRPFAFEDSTDLVNIRDRSRITEFLGSVSATYTPIPNLELQATIGYQGSDFRQDQTLPRGVGITNNGDRAIFTRRNQQYTYDFNARYRYNILSNLEATTIVGGQAFNRILRTFFMEKQNFITELISNIGAGADFIQGDEGFSHSREAGIYAQQEFAYDNKLFVSLGLRRDYASAVGRKAPSIFYPKASMALRLDQFDFTPDFFTLLKLRIAYGETGVLPNPLDGFALLFGAEPSGYGAGATPEQIGNPEIEPERVRELEVGFDAELYNRIGIEFTYYRNWATNSIIDFRNPPSTGLIASAVPFNVGEAWGWGFESSLTANVWRTRNYSLDFTLIWNWSRNEVKDLGGAQPIFDGFDTNVIKEGLPRSAFYTFRSEAVFDENGVYQGSRVITDENGEAKRFYLGTPYPEHSGSFSVNFRFLRNFTFYALADWQLGLKVLNLTKQFQVRFGGNKERNILAAQLGLLDPNRFEYTKGIQPLQPGTPEYRRAAERHAALDGNYDGNFVEDADFLRLRELSLRYDFTDLLRRTELGRHIKGLSLAISARNVWLTTKYSGVDPELNFAGGRSLSRGQDFLTLPHPRVIYGTLVITL
ncbi:TonB-dependent receptor domain-containing protein [Rhodothermus marinus]|uniref:TonB-dependent receptor domain-containing protein n=1 Tax=Rhodothermus marinus TaxID=29549 RepID=UPI00137517FD|nr:TonB-dependent receptor [Rhodothermus marinus]